MNQQKGLAPILIVLLIAVSVGGYLIYTNYQLFDLNSWKTYEDWYSARFSFKHPDNWSLHSEVVLMYPNKSFRENLKELPFESYLEKYITINDKEILIRDVINAGQGYGRVVEARIPYAKNSYIWLTGRKEGLEDRKATDSEMDEFIKIVNTLNIKNTNLISPE